MGVQCSFKLADGIWHRNTEGVKYEREYFWRVETVIWRKKSVAEIGSLPLVLGHPLDTHKINH